jgi:glycosyltransferase involved in cell wall biosynthesis
MKVVAHVLPWTGVGGTEHATLRIARAVAPRYRSVFFCAGDAPEVEEFFRLAGEQTVRYPRVEPSLRSPFRYLWASWQLAAELRRCQATIVHAADWTGVQYVALAAKLAGCRLISHVRNRNESIPRRDWRPLRLVDRFVFVSQHTAHGFGYPGAARRFTVLYDGIQPPAHAAGAAEVRAEFGLPANCRLIGMAARVAEQKDFPTLIAAAARLRQQHPGARYLILGDYERHPEHRQHFQMVQAELARHGVADLFHFAGFRTDVGRLLGGLDLFVLSTHWEGLPLVILEAMAQALPVVATSVDGIPEVVDDGRTGLLVPHAEPAPLAAALGRLLDDAETARRMGQAGRQRVLAEFTPTRFASNLRTLYDELAS